MPAAPVRPVVSTALLVPQDRIARPPVPTWAGRLRAQLEYVRSRERRRWEFAEAIGTLSNNTALLAAFQGAAGRAEALCLGQMCWQHRTSRRSGDRDVAMLAVQPWVNLGRLQALSGDWRGALERFARLVEPGVDGSLRLGTVRVPSRACGTAGPGPGFGAFLRNVYVVDTLKALLSNGRYAEALAFAAAERGDSLNAARIAEGRLVAAARLGQHELAVQIGRKARGRWRGWTRAVFSLRTAEALACAGRVDEAAAELSALADVLAALSLAVRSRLESLYIVHRAAQACLEVGLPAPAARLAGGAVEAAGAAEDEVLRIESLRVLCVAAPDADARAALDELEAGTGYARYRRGCRPPLADPAADALIDELREFLAR